MKIYYLLLISLFISLNNAYAQSEKEKQKERFKLEDERMRAIKNFSKDYLLFTAKDHADSPINSDSLKGYYVFYIFGDSKCPPCVGLAKTINTIISEKRYEGKDLKFAFVTYEDKKGRDRLLKVHKLKFDYIISMTPEEMIDVGLAYLAKPTYVLVDKDSKVIFKDVGFPHELEAARKKFESLIVPELDKVLND